MEATVQAVVLALVPMLVLGQQTKCQTPTGDAGNCTPVWSCPDLYAVMISPNRTSQQMEQLKQAQCGQVELHPKVCCPRGAGGLAILPSECGRMLPDKRTAGDRVTGLHAYPWLALLEHKSTEDNKIRFGGEGTLIHERYILTTASSVTGRAVELIGRVYKVRLGEWDRHSTNDCIQTGEDSNVKCADPILRIRVEDVIPHKSFNIGGDHYDIALIRLANPAPYTDFIRPVCLAKTDVTTESFVVFRAAGWGEESAKLSAKKMHVLVPLVNQAVCRDRYQTYSDRMNLKELELCAGAPELDSCRGNAGSPLMTERDRTWSLHGLHSLGNTLCDYKGIPIVYTKVHAYLDWIGENIYN